MGRYVFRLPDIGEGIAEAEIIAWHVHVGDRVEEDGRLADMMTDKATIEMESPVAGTVVEVAGAKGDRIPIGSALVVIEVDGEEGDAPPSADEDVVTGERDAAPERNASASSAPANVAESEVPTQQPRSTAPTQAAPVEAPALSPAPQAGSHKVLASPAVRKRAKSLGIDLAQLRPAEDGRIRHADLDAFLAYNADGGFQPAGARSADEQVRVIGLRRRIAENMAASKRAIPHFSFVEECDVTALEETRAQLNEGRGERPRLTMLPLLIAAICKLLPRHRALNAHYDDEAGIVTRYGSVHLGLAVQTPAGLMVPVIRDAQDRNLWQLAAELTRLATAARDGSIRPQELSGSTITLTSLGPLGGVASTPIINRPEVAIIGPNRIVERPMFVRDPSGAERVEKRKLMNVSVSCDHRVVDGWDAASFVHDLKRLIEAPALILAG